MTAIEPDPELNRRLVAERLGWPEGAAEACRELERDFPEWMVFWSRGSYPEPSDRGYRAVLQRHNHHVQLLASDPATLRELVTVAQAALPPRWDERPPPTPLVVPED